MIATSVRLFALALVLIVFTFPVLMRLWNFTPQNKVRGTALGIGLFGFAATLCLIVDYIL